MFMCVLREELKIASLQDMGRLAMPHELKIASFRARSPADTGRLPVVHELEIASLWARSTANTGRLPVLRLSA
jgi:hypothetical protein